MLFRFCALFFSFFVFITGASANDYSKEELIEKRKAEFNLQAKPPAPNAINNGGFQQNIQTEQNRDSNFYDNKREGFYWYQDPKEQQKKEKNEEAPEKQNMSYEDLWEMHPDDFKELLQVRLKEAIRNPTEANVLKHLEMQDVAQKKATAYAAVVALVGQKHPTLLSESSYPTSAPGQRAQVKEAKKSLEDLIYASKDDFALIMFTAQGCSYCEEQKGINKYFQTAYGWEIREIDIAQNPKFASQFNIEMTPTLIIVSRENGEYMPISAGVISVDEISQRAYRSIRYLRKEIQPEQYFMKSSNEFDSGNPLRKGF